MLNFILKTKGVFDDDVDLVFLNQGYALKLEVFSARQQRERE